MFRHEPTSSQDDQTLKPRPAHARSAVGLISCPKVGQSVVPIAETETSKHWQQIWKTIINESEANRKN
jgi:hypothetical protein